MECVCVCRGMQRTRRRIEQPKVQTEKGVRMRRDEGAKPGCNETPAWELQKQTRSWLTLTHTLLAPCWWLLTQACSSPPSCVCSRSSRFRLSELKLSGWKQTMVFGSPAGQGPISESRFIDNAKPFCCDFCFCCGLSCIRKQVQSNSESVRVSNRGNWLHGEKPICEQAYSM